ncbi:MAG: hypothetical protein ABSA71_08735 [Desulfomonilia bacterium]|jgi:integrase
MKGSIQPHSSGRYWFIDWYQDGKHEKFYDDFLHGGEKFWRRHQDKDKCIGYKMAERCLTVMRNDWEAYQRGERNFDLSRYRGKFTDAIPYCETWLTLREPSLKPSSIHFYRSSVRHIIAFFERHPLHLHVVQKDTLQLMAMELPPAPKTKRNILGVFKEILRDACDSDRISKVPRFPTIEVPKQPKHWIDKATQEAILSEIPIEHQPIFRWMALHWRRVGEACALHRSDYDKRLDSFIIHRAISGGKEIDSIKTGIPVTMPCHPAFKPYMPKPQALSPYFFTNASSRSFGMRYTHDTLMSIWKAACAKIGVTIDMHRGFRTSGASSAINELGWSKEDAQAYGHWSSMAVMENHYGDYELDRIRALQRRVVQLVPNPSQTMPKNKAQT